MAPRLFPSIKINAIRLWLTLHQRRWHILFALGLLPVFATVYVASFALRFEGVLDANAQLLIATTITSVVFIKLVVFGWLGVYQGWGRFVTFQDLMQLGRACTVSSLLILAMDHLLDDYFIPRSILLMDWGGTLVVVGGLRCVLRFVDETRVAMFTGEATPVLIVGANDSGETLSRALRRNKRLPFRVLGFVTDRPNRVGTLIGGIPVLGLLEDTCKLARQHNAAEIFITSGELSGQQVRRLVDEGEQNDFHVKVLPSYEQLLRGTVAFQPREVSIEDLLRRDPVELQLPELHRWLDNRVALVTGSAGSIGSEIARQILAFKPSKLVLVDRYENGQFYLEQEMLKLWPGQDIEFCVADVRDLERMQAIFEEYQPDVVFHAAAYKHVPMMEANPGEAVKNIAVATRDLANLAHNQGIDSFVMISTDKAVNPTNVMGACKRVAELYVQSLAEISDTRFVTVRFGNVLDSAGSVVPIFRKQIAEGGPVTVTHPDIRRYFMTIPEAAQLVIQAGALGNGGEIFVLDMGQPVSIVELARDMIRLSGLVEGRDMDIEFVGLRPGEKLFEELHARGERHLPTAHEKIMVAISARQQAESMSQTLDGLARLGNAPAETIVSHLQSIVPEYAPYTPADVSRRAA